MFLPVQFDKNELFIIASIIIIYTVIWLLPKRFPLSITVSTMLLSTVLARLSDHILSGPLFDLYDIMDTGKYELFDFVAYFLYPPFAYIFVYFYDQLRPAGLWITVYIVCFSFLGTVYEGICVLFDVFHYKGWKLSYSFSYYLVIQSITLVVFNKVKIEHKKLAP